MRLIFTVAILAAAAALAGWRPAERLPDAVNSTYCDWGVCVSADGDTIYFSSNRPGSAGTDIYYSRRQGSGWTVAKKVEGVVNTAFDEGAPCISWDGTLLYFQRGLLGTDYGDIYVAVGGPGGWERAFKVPGSVNTADHWETNPAISADGSKLYFVGEGWPGNQNGCNIWRSTWTGNKWDAPVYLGDINTASGESDAAPTYDGRYLYFISFRVAGNIRIFRAEALGGSWGNIEQLGPNVNEPGYYQMDPSITADGKYLFFSRAKWGETDNYDIYVSRWSPAAVAPASLGRIKALFR